MCCLCNAGYHPFNTPHSSPIGLTNISPALITSKWMFYGLESKNIGFPGIMHTGSEALGRLTLLPEPHRVLCVL